MLFHEDFLTPVGYIRVSATNSNIVAIGFYERALSQADTNPSVLTQSATQQIKEYIKGQRKVFDLPLAPSGTEFQQRVWRQLQRLEYGQTASYVDIAKALNKPTASRAVGAANGKNPIGIVIPCHRVIGANGSLTGYAGGLDRKSFLLRLESARFVEPKMASIKNQPQQNALDLS